MILHFVLFIETVTICVSIKIGKFNTKGIQVTDYDYQRNERRTNAEEDILDKRKLNDTIFVDGIAHSEIKKGNHIWEKVNEVTFDINKILAAENVEYIYKRDHFWRTWRKVNYLDGQRVISYRCDGFIHATCKNCGRFWNIEEDCPCPYEFLSLINSRQLCVVNFTEPYNKNDSCPFITTFADVLRTCDNPIVTEYRITKVFNRTNPKHFDTICGDEYNCKITTFYMIYNDFMIFRLIKSNNAISYSRVMKPENKNYYCIKNCGYYDRKTNNVTKNKPSPIDSHNSQSSSHKHKHENALHLPKNLGNKTNSRSKLKKYKDRRRAVSKTKEPPEVVKSRTVSPCTKLSRQMTTEDYEENYVDENDYGHSFMK